MRYRIFLYLIIAIVTSIAGAQTLTIRDKLTGEPLEQVTIYSEQPNAATVTDNRGHAEISAFKTAANILIERVGYRPVALSYEQLAEIGFTLQLEQAPFSMSEVVVSASRWAQEKRDIPTKVVSIRSADMKLQNPQTAADLLSTSGEVFVQKSQLGGGSPMIRGFATNRVLIAVDGVRMNTAIFRSGNLQNVISLDPFATQRTEITFGPGSVMYGSDAISAVMGFYTLSPLFASNGKTHVAGNAAMRTSSANFEKTGHADIAFGGKKWAFLTSATVTDYNDQRMGGNGPDEYLRREYVATIDGRDSTIANPDPEEQVSTGFRQLNLMQKIRFKPAENWDLNLGIHYSGTSDYPRYDRLLRYRGDNLRSAEWYYGPQIWSMNALNILHSGSNRWYDNFSATAAYHFFKESRHDRDFRSSERHHRTETVDVFTANLDFEKGWKQRHLLFYGVEAVFNTVGSTGEDEDISTGIRQPGPSRYPDGAKWHSYGAYLNYRLKASQKLTLQAGTRFNVVTLDATFDTTFYPFPFTTAETENGAVIGSFGAAYKPADDWQFNANLSTGFRAPNVDDVGKIFDSEPGAVVVPNPGLEPEYAYNAELGISKIFGDVVKLDVAGYYTLLNNAMVRRDFTLNGQDSIVYDGELSRVFALQNAAEATVRGVEFGVEMRLPGGVDLLSRFSYQRGEEELDDGSTAPLRHAAPWFGATHLTYSRSHLKADLYAIYNGEIAYEDLAPEEQSKDYIYAIDDNGNPYSPGWFTLNLKSVIQLNDALKLSAGVENILDKRYRPYSSGIVAAGRNFIAAMYFTF
ncbi:MAG: TonB-dependent receptor [Calditrichaeota bacterium]|nr:TonB-dependent receptor [Calditrichota bacterium]MCB0268272.1 TonB-dependent receptor [Calditrichota bacterium]